MFKKLGIFALAFVFVVLPFMCSNVSAASTNYDLSGELDDLSYTTSGSVPNNRSYLFDNDLSTGITLGADESINFEFDSSFSILNYFLDPEVTIDDPMINISAYTYDGEQVLDFGHVNAHSNFADFSDDPHDNVGKIVISNQGSSSLDLNEFDINVDDPTTADTTAPEDPSGLSVSNVDKTSLNLSWSASSSSDVDHYNVYQNGTYLEPVMEESMSISDLSSDTSYTFNVTAVDADGNESVGISKTITTLANTDSTAPVAPSNVTAKSGNSYVNVSWDSNTEEDLAGYNVYVNGDKSNTDLIGSTAFTVNGLDNDSDASIRVSAVDTSGNESPKSTAITSTPSADNVPFIVLGYDLVDVADGITTWFSNLWLILAFAVGIPLAFLVSTRVKGLFVS